MTRKKQDRVPCDRDGCNYQAKCFYKFVGPQPNEGKYFRPHPTFVARCLRHWNGIILNWKSPGGGKRFREITREEYIIAKLMAS